MKCALLASILIGNVIATVYFFRPINNLEYAINWENSVVPCEDDRIRFDEEKIAVTMINEPIAVSEMSLPDDGIIFFAPNTALGQKGRWQCERKITPEDAFFQTKPAASFFSGSNWFASLDGEEIGHLLHALQIPSDQDTAVIQVSGANRMLIDDFVKLDSFLFSDEKADFAKCINSSEACDATYSSVAHSVLPAHSADIRCLLKCIRRSKAAKARY